MRKQDKPPTRYTLDGFVPRRRSSAGGERRPAMDTLAGEKTALKQRAARDIDFDIHQDSHESLVFGDDATVAGTLKNPLDLGEAPSKTKKPHFWQFKKRRAYKKEKLARMSRRRKNILRIFRILLIICLIIGLVMGWKFVRNTSKIFNGNILGLFNSTKLKGEDQGRVNILLAGTSEGDPGHGGADLTDSIMLLSLDTKNNSAFTVSIPRDLWVDYGAACTPGFQGKINAVYQCGNQIKFNESGYAKGGMGMLAKVVSENFGMPIHYYGKINYKAFKDAVDAVGGITVTIDSEDPRGVYDPNIGAADGGPLQLSNGKQKLTGKKALALARSRNSNGGYGMTRGDFDRTTYQRLMLVALKDKALSTGVIANPAKLGDLLDAAGNNVKTDFKTSELRRLYELSKKINNKNIDSIDLSGEKVKLVTTGSFSGQSIVQPVAGISDFSQIKLYFKKLTSTNKMVREDARIVVLNGSGVAGVAQGQADTLVEEGLTIATVGNANSEYKATVVIDKSKGTKLATQKFLESQFSVQATKDLNAYNEAALYDADFIIIIGNTTAKSLAMGSQ